MTRRVIPLLAALLVLALAIPAAAGKPMPNAELITSLQSGESCMVIVDVAVPKHGPRVGAVALDGLTEWEGEASRNPRSKQHYGFLNGKSSLLVAWVTAGTSRIEVTMVDHLGRRVVHETALEVTCELVEDDPRPSPT